MSSDVFFKQVIVVAYKKIPAVRGFLLLANYLSFCARS